MKKLFLIDGMGLAFRAYHAMNETRLTNKSGEPTGAIYGFVNIITAFLEKGMHFSDDSAENIAVVFDCRQPTFRHKLYEQYKANRKEFPEDLGLQLPYIKNFLANVGIPTVEKPGFEADDIIGTLAKNASQNQIETYCITSDKDFYQLLNENVFILRPQKNSSDFELIGKNDVKEKFGVEASQVIDYLALIGDTSDNVPGVKGVGEKTAIPLIEQFNSIENIYENIDKIEKERTKKLLLDGKESAFLSKELVTIKTDVELDFDCNSCKKTEPNYQELDELFQHLGFKQLRERWKKKQFFNDCHSTQSDRHCGLDPQSPENDDIQGRMQYAPTSNAVDRRGVLHTPTDNNTEIAGQASNDGSFDYNEFNEFDEIQYDNINTIPHEYILVDMKNINTMLADIAHEPLLAIAIETDISDKNTSEIVGISFCNSENKAYYLPLTSLSHKNEANLFDPNPDGKLDCELIIEYVLGDLQVILEDQNIQKLGFKIKETAYLLKRYGINLSPIIFAPRIAAFLISPADELNFKTLAEKYLAYSPINLSDFIKNKKQENFGLSDLTLEQKRDYFCELAHYSYKLKFALTEKLNENNLNYVASNIEFPLIEVLIDMQNCGITVDENKLKEIGISVEKEITELKKQIYSETNEEFNIDSPKQLADVLYNKMGLKTDFIKKNKTGLSTDLQALTELAQIHPVANLVLNYRKFSKIKNTYIDALPKLINPVTKKIHTTFNQASASTGRLSSTEPNLQNIPIRTELGKEIRAAFTSQSEDFLLLSADYSQIELRIMAFLSNDSNLISAFKNNIDIHTATASLLFQCDVSEIDAEQRRTAKTVNFGIMYGLGSFGLSQRLGITRKAADEIIHNYFEQFSGIKKYISDTLHSVREVGYAETMTGRRRYFPDINHSNHHIRAAAERAAINMPIQGSASDLIKMSMLNIYQVMKQNNMKSKMILQVHDELVFEAAIDEIDWVADIVNTNMLYSFPLDEVPLAVSIGFGKTWLESHG